MDVGSEIHLRTDDWQGQGKMRGSDSPWCTNGGGMYKGHAFQLRDPPVNEVVVGDRGSRQGGTGRCGCTVTGHMRETDSGSLIHP